VLDGNLSTQFWQALKSQIQTYKACLAAFSPANNWKACEELNENVQNSRVRFRTFFSCNFLAFFLNAVSYGTVWDLTVSHVWFGSHSHFVGRGRVNACIGDMEGCK